MPRKDESAPAPGTRDLREEDLALLRDAQQRLQTFLSTYGYRAIDVPLLERTDLYLRKLGSRVAAHLFTLTDQQGERLCLRPEFTGSAIRHYIGHADALPLPVRWQYWGPVFRDWGAPEPGVPGREGRPDAARDGLRQFTQLGAELIGSTSVRSDAELLALACKGLQLFGLSRPRLVIGHAGLLPKLLAGLHLSERVKTYVAGHLEMLRDGDDGTEKLRRGLEQLRALPPDRLPAAGSPSGLMASDEAAGLIRWLLSEGMTRPTGRRTPEEILHRFQAKLQTVDSSEDIQRAVALAADLAPVRAAPPEAVARGRAIVESHGLDASPLDELERLLALLAAHDLGAAAVEVDLGLTRALGYYTGTVFELFAGGDAARPVGGGGRYDGLVRALGGPQDVPALGFAYTLESLVGTLPSFAQTSDRARPPVVLVVPLEDADLPKAIDYTESLRSQGRPSMLEVMGWSEEERFRYCRAMGIARVALVRAGQVDEIAVAGERASYAPAGAS